jgi:glycolate oxidase FAD binding subunit
MVEASDVLSLTKLVEPAMQEEVVDHLRACHSSATPNYTIGGGTSLDYGLPGRSPGVGLRLTRLNRVIDYPARDMTITVEAGMTMAALSAELARQVDTADAEQATLGGMIATNFSGPRRYGYGTLRDYVIGISAVDGRGTPFKAGGRVVKNVAGYDLCKLLTGSLGTLAVITQVTLKVRPQVESTALVACYPRDWRQAERLLAALVSSCTTPVAIELLGGAACDPEPGAVGKLLVGFEGSGAEVAWQMEQLATQWHELGVAGAIERFPPDRAGPTWQALGEPPRGMALTIKANVRPSAVTDFMQLLLRLDPGVWLQAHAGNGIVIAGFPEFAVSDAGRILVQTLQPAAIAAGGHVVVWHCSAGELTRQATWGSVGATAELMRSVKQQFDPKGLLNPGRFLFANGGTP